MGLGQLNCQGLQRSLRLPAWLGERFPPPDAIYAPDPSVKATEIHGDGQRYDYVRPLVTIAPTAISLGLPVNTQLPFNDSGRLADELLAERYRNATLYVAWEHLQIINFAQVVLRRLGSEAEDIFTRGTREAIENQIQAGIDIPTDGEIRRENYIHMD